MTSSRTSTTHRSRRNALGVAALLATLGVLVPGAISADQKAGDIDSTRTAIEKWVETRRVISHEQREWALGKEMLNERIELIRREITSLRSKIDETQANITKADLAREDLVSENDAFKNSSASLTQSVTDMESRTRALLARLPDPIRERVKPLSQRLPNDSAETKLSMSERYQNVVGILNEINKFNREITLASEVRTLRSGVTAEVTTMYVGIGQGYYVGGNGTIAGYGTATDDAWVWVEADAAAPEIAQAIAMLKNEQVAAFVRLPAEIK